MSLLRQIEEWGDKHNPKWLAFLRAALGIFLLMRGVAFLENNQEFEELILNSGLHAGASFLAAVIPWFHIVGGLMIIIGLLTRFACIVQIPILLGALFFVNTKRELFTVETTFAYTIILLLLLIVFFVEGSGPLSIANYLKSPQR